MTLVREVVTARVRGGPTSQFLAPCGGGYPERTAPSDSAGLHLRCPLCLPFCLHHAAVRCAGKKENTSLRQILAITRAVGSSLERDLILAELSSGAKRLGGFSNVVVWRFNELDTELEALYPPEAVERYATPQPANSQPA